jgi:hypothetical protein
VTLSASLLSFLLIICDTVLFSLSTTFFNSFISSLLIVSNTFLTFFSLYRVLQQAGMVIWNVTASSASYTPTTSPSSLSLSLSSSLFFLSDKDTVVTTLGIEGEEVEGEGEGEEEDVSAIFSRRRMEGEHGILDQGP